MFKVLVDHEVLNHIIDKRDLHWRIKKWKSLFAEYDFEVQHRPRLRNANAYTSSRSLNETDLFSSVDLEYDLNWLLST